MSVLAPNGRRHTVKVTPSTVLLQVRPPARVGNRRTGGQAEGPRWPRPGPPLRLLPGCGAGPGPGGRRLRQPMGAFRAAARPIPWLGPGGGAGCSEAPFLSPGTAGDLTTPRPCCWRPGVFGTCPNSASSVTGKRGAPACSAQGRPSGPWIGLVRVPGSEFC